MAALIPLESPVCPLQNGEADGHQDLACSQAATNIHKQYTDPLGRNALALAICNGDKDTCIALLASGSSVNAISARHGKRAIHFASSRKDEQFISMLHAHGAELEAPDEYGRTPLHYAAAACNQAGIRYLLQSGVDALVKNAAGESALECAILHADSQVGQVDTVQLLWLHVQGLLTNERDAWPYIQLAAACGNNAVLQTLLDEVLLSPALGSDGHSAACSGLRCALASALASGAPESIHKLLAEGADARFLVEVGDSAVHLAVKRGGMHEGSEENKGLMKDLLLAGGFPTSASSVDISPIDSSISRHQLWVVSFFLSAGLVL